MRAVGILVMVLLAGQAAAQPYRRGILWYYLDPTSTRCVPIHYAFLGAETPDDVLDMLATPPGAPPVWRMERVQIHQMVGAELVHQRTGRRYHFFDSAWGCLGYRNLIFGR
jgi:hypothetical protein